MGLLLVLAEGVCDDDAFRGWKAAVMKTMKSPLPV